MVADYCEVYDAFPEGFGYDFGNLCSSDNTEGDEVVGGV